MVFGKIAWPIHVQGDRQRTQDKLVLLKRASLDIQNKKLNCSTEESWVLCGSAVGKFLSQRTI